MYKFEKKPPNENLIVSFKTYNVVEDIKLLNERDTLPGFIPLERCLDTSNNNFKVCKYF